uniref:Bis(5'-adenosyl)-triphosphatase n=1 Tax=Panagrolaimus sp. JU765 TaxID=591449 RepID=A0AC34RAK4_9BILA
MMSTEIKRSSLIGVVQLTCTHDKEENLAKCKDMIARAKQQGCQMIFFPECTDYIGRNKKEAIDMSENTESATIKAFRELAKNNQIWISIGGFHNRKDETKMPYNTHLILNSDGVIVQEYDKLHQFNLDMPGTRLLEREFSTEGNTVLQPFTTPIGNIGMGICYDVRFPELSTYYRRCGAHILTYPAAFTVPTGSVHWEVLLRCRAIENQCYVVCAAQFGVHNPNRISYGHAMVVDPNGAVIAQCSDKEDLIVAKIDLDYLDVIRSRLNILGDRRKDLYTVHFKENLAIKEAAKFAEHVIPAEQIFYETQKSFAFVNIKPVTNGHVLVAPKRVTKYFQELTLDEVCDLMTTVQTVQKALLVHHKLTDSTVSIQDGPLSGQTVQHVHVHVVPRRPNDFANDDIYKELEDRTKTQPIREPADMASEAAAYRKILNQ